MLQETNAIDVYFEDQIQILVPEPDHFRVDAIQGVLSAKNVAFTSIVMKSSL